MVGAFREAFLDVPSLQMEVPVVAFPLEGVQEEPYQEDVRPSEQGTEPFLGAVPASVDLDA